MNNFPVNQYDLVLVTGASGFVGSHCVKEALSQGYRVRATVRNADDEKKVAPVRKLCPDEKKLEIISLELQSEQEVWNKVLSGCTYVLHVASPVIIDAKKNERMSRVIQPAIDGMERLMTAAKQSGTVKRVVMTSSIASIMSISRLSTNPYFTEDDWCDYSEPGTGAYEESKTREEEAAYEYVKKHETSFDVVAINPGYIVGPVLSSVFTPSAELIIKVFTGPPVYLDMKMPAVDVRDVAEMHVKAMTDKRLSNERVIAANEPSGFLELIGWLNEKFGPEGYTFPRYKIPNWVVNVFAPFNPMMKMLSRMLGKDIRFRNDKPDHAQNMQQAYQQNDPNTSGKEEPIKNHFITREGTYKLMTLSEYSRPSRVPLNSQAGGTNVSSAPVRVSFLTIPPNNPSRQQRSSSAAHNPTAPGTTGGASKDVQNNSNNGEQAHFHNSPSMFDGDSTSNSIGGGRELTSGRDSPTECDRYYCPDRICFNVGRELYVYMYKGVRNAADLSKPVDKRVYKGTYPTCHDFNPETANFDSCSLIIGFSAGQIQLIDPFRKDYQVSKLYNEERLIDKTRVTCLKWVPGQAHHFLASHGSGCLYLYNEELPCSPGAPSYQSFKTGDAYSVHTCKSKSTRNPMYRWTVGQGSLNEFAFSGPDAKLLATVSQDGYLRVFNYHSMELVGCMRSYFGGLLCVAWSPDTKYIATGGEDDMVTVYAVQEKRVVCRGQGHKSWISQVAFDPYTTLLPDGTSATAGVPVDLGSEEDLRPSNFVGASTTPFRSVVSSGQTGTPVLSSAGVTFRRSKMDSVSSASLSLQCYRLGSVGHDTQLCLWDITEDLLKYHFKQHRTSSILQQNQSHNQLNTSTGSGSTGVAGGQPVLSKHNQMVANMPSGASPNGGLLIEPGSKKEEQVKQKSGRTFLGRKKDKNKQSTQSEPAAKTNSADTTSNNDDANNANTTGNTDSSQNTSSGSSKKLHRRGFSIGNRLGGGGSNTGGSAPRSARGGSTGAANEGVTESRNAKNGLTTTDDSSRILGTYVCPRMHEVPMIEPLVCKKIAHERLTVLEFREDCIVTACQEGFICTWARPGRTQGLSHQQSINSPNPGGSPNLLPGGTVV